MFDDLIKKKIQDYLYKVFNDGSVFLDFRNKKLELKGNFSREDFKILKESLIKSYGKIITQEIYKKYNWTMISLDK